MDQQVRNLSIEEKKSQFRKAAIRHRLLEQTDRTIMRAIREPAGFAFLLVHGPTGVGKSKMIETLTERINGSPPSPHVLPVVSRSLQTGVMQLPLLLIEARPPDGSAFNRAYYYRTLLSLMGERTYQQQIHVDIHAEAALPKRRKVTGKAAQFNDLPELREAAEEAMHRHGVQVIIVDEAHHMMYTDNGGPTVALQDQLEWLKSMRNTTHVLHVLVGTYDLLNFGKLNGQISRRSLPVHFPRYQLQREEDCLEFQAALLVLLQKVPLHCDAETFTREYWLYFYECSIGCIGVLKDWLLRAVCTALDEGQDHLTLDWIQDHAPLVDQYRQMALDATEGEQKLHHTESNREHVWRLLQGGELIAPVPPLPPRGTLSSEPASVKVPFHSPLPLEQTPTPTPSPEDVSPAPVKKTRVQKKQPAETTRESVSYSEPEAAHAPAPLRRRRKKASDPIGENAEADVKVVLSMNGENVTDLTDTGKTVSTKLKRTRRVGEPKPKRYAVGEKTTDNPA